MRLRLNAAREGASHRPSDSIAHSMPEIRHLITALQRQGSSGLAMILNWSTGGEHIKPSPAHTIGDGRS